MFDTPEQVVVPLNSSRTKPVGGNIHVSPRIHAPTRKRILFPKSSDMIALGQECLGVTSGGRHYLRGVSYRGASFIEFTIIGKPDPAAIDSFVARITAYESITLPEFDFAAWTNGNNPSDGYASSFHHWRIGTRDGSVRIFPTMERVRDICAHFCTPNVLISFSQICVPAGSSNHVMLMFRDFQPAVIVDRIAYHIAKECTNPT